LTEKKNPSIYKKTYLAQKWKETNKDVEEKKTENNKLVKKIKKDKKESLRKSGR
jgi:hypothetical protein